MSSIMRISCYLLFLTAKGHEKDTPSPNPSQNEQIDIILISPPEISQKSFLLRAFEDIKCQLNENVMSWVSCHVLRIGIALVNWSTFLIMGWIVIFESNVILDLASSQRKKFRKILPDRDCKSFTNFSISSFALFRPTSAPSFPLTRQFPSPKLAASAGQVTEGDNSNAFSLSLNICLHNRIGDYMSRDIRWETGTSRSSRIYPVNYFDSLLLLTSSRSPSNDNRLFFHMIFSAFLNSETHSRSQ